MPIHTAQPLNNIGFHIIEIDRDFSTIDLDSKQIIFRISNVRLRGKELYVSDTITLYYTEQEFIVQTIPVDTDVAGRLSGIISYAKFPPNTPNTKEKTEDYFFFVSDSIARFSKKIDRTLFPNSCQQIESGLKRAWENRRFLPLGKPTITLSKAAVVAVVVTGIFIFLASGGFHRPTINLVTSISIGIALAGIVIFIIPYTPQSIRFLKTEFNQQIRKLL